MKGQRALWPAALFSAAIAALPSMNHTPARAATSSDTLIVASNEAPVDMDPASSYDSQAASVLRGSYEGLVKLNGSSTTEITGALATSWSVSDRGKTYTFQLRHGVTFHDGTPFTADAEKA